MLSPRLNALLNSSIPEEDFWDICCDHGLLGRAAMARGSFARVHFVDQVPHIIENLKEKVSESEDVRIVLKSAEDITEILTGTVVIAGVGGHSLIKILGQWREREILRAKRLVLNPMSHVEPLREFLAGFDTYKIKETIIVRESERDREILILERSR